MNDNTGDLRLNGVLDRLELILVRENECIGRDASFDIAASSAAKSRCLYELTRLSQAVGPDGLSAASRRRLEAVRPILKANEARLRAHVEAVRAVTQLLKEAVQAAEADGTYSFEHFGSAASRAGA